ncbi:ala-interacting subunit 1-like protein, partial [Trifolium pratense]
RYVKSRSDKQLWNKASESDTSNCSPEDKTKGNAPIVPCGLIAWSLFNDTYKFSMNNKDLTVNKKNIAWSSDRGSKFGPNVYPKNFQSGELIGGGKLDESIPLSEQEDLIVWMRTAALPTFRKLYGKIETDLEANNEIEIVIQNNYNTYEFGGKKNLVLSTTTWIGGKNPFLGMAYLVVGGLSLFCAIGFILLYVIKPRLNCTFSPCLAMWTMTHMPPQHMWQAMLMWHLEGQKCYYGSYGVKIANLLEIHPTCLGTEIQGS